MLGVKRITVAKSRAFKHMKNTCGEGMSSLMSDCAWRWMRMTKQLKRRQIQKPKCVNAAAKGKAPNGEVSNSGQKNHE